jgi:signal transduction histidine kinase/CheY-like chemotaxis protein
MDEKRTVDFYQWLLSVEDQYTPVTHEFTLRSRDGRNILLEANMRMIRQNGNYAGFEGIARDITERKMTERALEVSNLQLQDTLEELRLTQDQIVRQERLRALGQMAGGVAHDFNNALMPIVGFSELLIQRPEYLADHERTKRYLNLVLNAAQGAAQTVRRLREFYREQGIEDERSPVDLASVIREAIDLTEPKWKNESQANGVSIEIRTDIAPARPVMGDARGLRESFVNLILNAIDAMPKGGVLTFAIRQRGEDTVAEVRDTGVGMSTELRAKCLEPFFTTKEARGTGLGLAMVHGIVSRHGGSIEIESAEGRGTTFRVRLPSTESRIESKPGDAEGTGETAALRILLAEDDSAIREYLIVRLRMEGHDVDTAQDGLEGWERYQRDRYDMVITDYSMPRLNGDGLSRLIKERDPRMPVLLLTGFGDLIQDGDEPPGVDLILSKPLRFEELRSGIRELTKT